MINTMTIDGYDAVIQYDPDIKLFRGEFVGLNGGADFYAKSVDGLETEGHILCGSFFRCARKRASSHASPFPANLSFVFRRNFMLV